MARLTVEDCLPFVENRFELVILAAKRARKVNLSGEEPFVPWDNDKPTVVALREIAAGYRDQIEQKTTTTRIDTPSSTEA